MRASLTHLKDEIINAGVQRGIVLRLLDRVSLTHLKDKIIIAGVQRGIVLR